MASCLQPFRQVPEPVRGARPGPPVAEFAIFKGRTPFVETAWGAQMSDAMALDPIQGPYDNFLVLKVLNPNPADTIADIGCGYGRHVRKLRAMLGPRGRVLGRDVRLPTLLKAKAKGIPQGCFFELSNYDNVRIPAQTLDRAYMTQVWGTVESQPTRVPFLKSLLQALKPGGELIIVQYPSRPSDPEDFRQTLDAAAQAAGFEPGRRWQLWDPHSNRGPSWLFEFRRPRTHTESHKQVQAAIPVYSG